MSRLAVVTVLRWARLRWHFWRIGNLPYDESRYEL